MIILNCPHHIVQPGPRRNVVFVGDDGYRYYLENPIEAKTELGVKVYEDGNFLDNGQSARYIRATL